MTRVWIVSDGASVGSLRIPPFELHAGELICLHMPSPARSNEEDRLIQALTGERCLSGIRPSTRVFWVEPASAPARLLRFLREPRIADWLSKVANLSRAEAIRGAEGLGLPADGRLDQLGATPRFQLGLEAVRARGAEALVFSTSGLDPLGVRAAFDSVLLKIDRCPAVYFSHESVIGGTRQRDCPPRGICVELSDPTSVATPLSTRRG